MKPFTHLHLHSVHSLLDGFTKIPDLVQVVTEHGMDAVAITDHGNMSGVPYLFKEAHANGIKPIGGIEAYICEDASEKSGGRSNKAPYYHITLLAKSERGYRNLCKLSSMSYTDGFYSKPRVDAAMLAMWGADVICLSGCVGGWPASCILRGDVEKARAVLEILRSSVEDFYVELMWTGEPDQKVVNKALVEIARKDNLKCVVTGDSHYTWKEQADDHDTLFAMGLHKKKADPTRLKFIKGQYHIKSAIEMYALGFPDQFCRESYEISQMCESYTLPRASGIPVVYNAYDTINMLAWEGLALRIPDCYSDPQDTYANRLLMELETVKELKYEGYFAVAHEICEFARGRGLITGWGRGSSAGSLLSYCLFITHIDPVKYNLFFERFLNASRREPPDIDLDFSDTERPQIIEYLANKYGTDSVGHIATYGTLGPRQVIIDAGKTFDKDEQTIKMALEAIPHDPTAKVQDILDNEGLIKHVASVLGPEVVHAMEVFQNIPRSASVHAAGFLIDKSKLCDTLPFMVSRSGDLTIQYDYDALKELGYEKFDILGVRTLRVLHACASMMDVDIHALPLDDCKTYDLLCRGDTVGVFQLEGWGYQTFLKKFRPRNFTDVMLTNALYRPGPMQGGKGLDEIIARRHGKAQIRYMHHSLEQELKSTYGVMVYQEQVMATVRILAGWDLAKADELRYAIGKKKIDEVKALRGQFILDCGRLGHKQAFAEDAFQQIEFFSRYGWNKAHSAAYGMVTYACAYLKANYRREFMLALMNSEIGNHEKLARLYKDVNRSGIKLYAPHVNFSTMEYIMHNGGILTGLSAIKGIGGKAATAIITDRDASGGYTSIRDFEARVPRRNVNILMRGLLAQAMAFRDLPQESDNDHAF